MKKVALSKFDNMKVLSLLILICLFNMMTCKISKLKNTREFKLDVKDKTSEVPTINVENPTLQKRIVISFTDSEMPNKEKKAISTTMSIVQKRPFFEGFFTSMSLNFFAELGDKSFLLIITLYNTFENPFILLGICLCGQLTMSSLSVILGNSLGQVSSGLTKVFYLVGFLLFAVYGISFLYDYIKILNEEDNKKENEKIPDQDESFDIDKNLNDKDEINRDNRNERKKFGNSMDSENCKDIKEKSKEKKKDELNISEISLKIVKSLTTETQESTIKKYLKVYGVVFLAEVGDRSSITTIILSTKFSAISILMGNVVAHALGITSAMIVGFLLKNNINLNLLKLLSAMVFFAFSLEMGYNYITCCTENIK